MILETEQERQAFEFICNIASDATSRAGCNDLDKDTKEKFKGLTVKTDDNGELIDTEVMYDFDVIEWLRGEVNGR